MTNETNILSRDVDLQTITVDKSSCCDEWGTEKSKQLKCISWPRTFVTHWNDMINTVVRTVCKEMLKFQNVWLIMSADTLFSATMFSMKSQDALTHRHILVPMFHFGSMQRCSEFTSKLHFWVRAWELYHRRFWSPYHWISYRDDKEQGYSCYFRQ